MAERLQDGTLLRWYDWLLPWRARRVIRTYAAMLSIEVTGKEVMKAYADFLKASREAD